MKLYLIRHGQTDWNIQGKIQGSHDIPLNDTGRAQAKLVAEGMDSRPVTKIFSSTLMRAVETARMIGDRQHVDIYLVVHQSSGGGAARRRNPDDGHGTGGRRD